MRNEWSRGLMPRHCPAMPSLSSASLRVAVSRREARSTLESVMSLSSEEAVELKDAAGPEKAVEMSLSAALERGRATCADITRSAARLRPTEPQRALPAHAVARA